MKRTLLLQAYAKINIGLWVRFRRQDGFHEISTLMQSISLKDTILLKETKEDGIRIECSHSSVPCDSSNIAFRAACHVLKKIDVAPRLLIQIDKKIPVAAGLGGGSADGAAIINGLLKMYNVVLANEEIMNIAIQTGSDVPFLIRGGLALAGGRGEKLSFFEPPKVPLYVLIACPTGVEVPTKWAYDNCMPSENIKKEAAFSRLLAAYNERDLATLRTVIYNDLESVAMQRFPQIGRIMNILNRLENAVVSMSGSGPSVFALLPDRNSALLAAGMLKDQDTTIFVEQISRGLTP